MVESGFLSAEAHAEPEAEPGNGKFDGARRNGGNKNVRLGHGLLHELVPAHVYWVIGTGDGCDAFHRPPKNLYEDGRTRWRFGQPFRSRDAEPFPRLCRTYFARCKSIF